LTAFAFHGDSRPVMSSQDKESELSYAYLHAVASSVGAACQQTTRTRDNLGIDATLSLVHDFGARAVFTDLGLNVQLKATTKLTATTASGTAYPLDIDEYDRLRQPTHLSPRLLVVLFLPADEREWLDVSVESLVIQRCAYWLSLQGAPESLNKTNRTVYFPPEHALTTEGLFDIFRRVAHREELRYAG